tara:strand:- start:188 stop:715 length:528 start_codon:yes stop_codon:yes gene_type:complete
MALKDYYVYAYMREDMTPYYIGKGCLTRINDRHGDIPLPPENRRVKIKEGLSERESLFLERKLITKFKRKIDGGILENKILPDDLTQPRKYHNSADRSGLKQVSFWLTPEERINFRKVCKTKRISVNSALANYVRKTIEDENIVPDNSDELSLGIMDMRRRLIDIEGILEKHQIK